jgi:hypothetical protein
VYYFDCSFGCILIMRNYLITFVIGLAGAIFFTTANNFFNAPRTVAVVKLDSILGGHLKKYGAKEMDDDELKKVSTAFGIALNDSIEFVSEEHNVVLFVAPAVVSSGITDFTPVIEAFIDSRMERVKK